MGHAHFIITPRSSRYSVPASTCSVQRDSRSRLRTFWDFAYVQAQHSPSRSTYQSGIRCGQPSAPTVAHVSVRCSSRNARTSASLIAMAARLIGRRLPRP